ncbi:MAG: methylenetetrahydrofolate--tRNA-(uracil(54)-C(5))-methyltransferase (FADH(2)-oxidizing) TrmFO [Candidatus Krumholzibacteriota bacterium]|nr:methylenetetrahydrofolate--tRNA-(uracil(54)-C(5))-methyltransferase (FADH(2)-oxidizing) TrmFO [Candidatus Krumholzibacteriota bacterium]
MYDVTVVGGGLAGSEAALQLADRGLNVQLLEMRPGENTPAHKTSSLAELVCSNSLKSESPQTASGLLKKELSMLGCRLLGLARETRVPAGHALAVDRDLFASAVTNAINNEKRIVIVNREQKDLNFSIPAIIATGPLTSKSLSEAIISEFSSETLFFYDAISISVNVESIDHTKVFKGSRYGKGADDYWNIPFSREEYQRLVAFLKGSPSTASRDFEEKRYFDACLPVEVLASRGDETLRFGPLKPKGLIDPATGKEPFAVLQLRQETLNGTMAGLVGFQSRLTRKGQKELMKLIPGLEKAEILRWGSIHRNTYLDSPRLLDAVQMSRMKEGIYFSGQITGVEGYMESIAHGLLTARNLFNRISGKEDEIFPEETILGGLQRHLSNDSAPFQPMNANFGILPAVDGKRKDRKRLKYERSVAALERFLESS